MKELSGKKQIGFSIIIVVLVLCIGELSIRLWAYYFRTSYEIYNYTKGRLELVPNLKYERNGYQFLINSKGFVGKEFEDVPDAGVYRIISVGDSCTFSLGLWQIGYPRILEQLLNSQRNRIK